jgi:hypothetical protein
MSRTILPKTFFIAVVAAGLIATPLPSLIQSAAAQSAQPAAPAKTKATAKTKKPPSASQIALHERQKKCGEEWRQAKATGKIEKGMKWPKFWSACNKRLKNGS